MSGLLELIGVNGGRLSIDKRLKVMLEPAHAGVHEDLLGTASNYDSDVDIAGPKYYCIRAPATGELHLVLAMDALTAGTLEITEGADVVPVGTSTAFTLANELRTDFAVHAARANRHITGQQSTAGMPAAANSTATLLALVNALTTYYAAHNADAILAAGWAWHNAQQAVSQALAAVTVVTTVAEAVTRLNDMKAKYNAHETVANTHNSVAHVAGDEIAAADAALTASKDYGTLFTAHFRNNRSSVAAVGSYFWEDPEFVASTGTLIHTRRCQAARRAEIPAEFRRGSELILKASTSYLLKFTSDADNNKLWFEAEYCEVPA